MCFGILGLVGAAVSAAGSLAGGMATADAAKYQSQVAANNAQIAEQNAAYAAHAGQAKAQDKSLQGSAQSAQVMAAMAAGGVDINSGSAVDVKQSEREETNLSTQRETDNANLQVYGYRSQAMGFQAQSQLDAQEAAQAPIGAAFGAAGGLLSNASSIGLKGAFSGVGNPNTASAGDQYINAGLASDLSFG